MRPTIAGSEGNTILPLSGGSQGSEPRTKNPQDPYSDSFESRPSIRMVPNVHAPIPVKEPETLSIPETSNPTRKPGLEGEFQARRSFLWKLARKISEEGYHKDCYEEELSHNLAYLDLQENDELPGKRAEATYRVEGVFKNSEGLIGYGLVSNGGDPPILLFQGTDVKNKAQIRLDSDPDIGAQAVEVSKVQLENWLQKHPGATLTGHSLGGAIAQQVAARYPENIARVVTFCAPGVRFTTANEFQQAKNREGLEVTHYFTQGDPVSRAGDTHLPGNIYTLPNSGKLSEAHTVSALYDSGKGLFPNLEQPRTEKTLIEKLRTSGLVQNMAGKKLDNLSPTLPRGKKSRSSPFAESSDTREWVEAEEIKSQKPVQNMAGKKLDNLSPTPPLLPTLPRVKKSRSSPFAESGDTRGWVEMQEIKSQKPGPITG